MPDIDITPTNTPAEGATTPQASGAAEVTPPNGSGQQQPVTEQKEGQADQTPEQLKAIIAKQSKEIGRHIKTIKGFQARQGADEPKTAKPAESGDINKHPLLEGLKRDEEGDIILHGMAVSPELALHIRKMETTLEELQGAESGRQSAARDAEIKSANTAFLDAFTSTLSEMRDKALPNLPKELQSEVDETLHQMGLGALQKALAKGGELNEEMVEQIAIETMDKARRMFSIHATNQLQNNADYAKEHPTKPDGQTGTPKPTDESKLSKTDQYKLAEERAKAAELRVKG